MFVEDVKAKSLIKNISNILGKPTYKADILKDSLYNKSSA